MADPVSGMIAIGAVASVAGAIQSGQAAKAQSEFQAQMAEKNSQLALQQSAEEERSFRVQTSKQLGDMRASYAASGVDSTQGSALDVLQESAANAEFDALKIKHAGILKSKGFQAEAGLERFRGQQAETGSYLNAVANAGNGVAQYYSYGNRKSSKASDNLLTSDNSSGGGLVRT